MQRNFPQRVFHPIWKFIVRRCVINRNMIKPKEMENISAYFCCFAIFHSLSILFILHFKLNIKIEKHYDSIESKARSIEHAKSWCFKICGKKVLQS